MYYTYILQSNVDNTLYKGFTTDLKQRVADHNNGKVTSTAKKRPYRLVWYCAFADENKALRFERYLKSGSGREFTKRFLK